MLIKNVPYYSQIKMRFIKYVNCYNTSNAIRIKYLLNIFHHMDQDIDCPLDMELPDYIYQISESDELKKWVKDNVSRLGYWMLKMARREIGVCQDWMFNKLMNQYGLKSEFRQLDPEEFFNQISEKGFPFLVCGRFPALQGGGHVCCCVGYSADKKTLLVHDPFGDANTKYKSRDGIYKNYDISIFLRDGKIWCNATEAV